MNNNRIQIKVFYVFVFCYPFITCGIVNDNFTIPDLLRVEILKTILNLNSLC